MSSECCRVYESGLCIEEITLYVADHFQSKGHAGLDAHVSHGHLFIDKWPHSPSHSRDSFPDLLEKFT